MCSPNSFKFLNLTNSILFVRVFCGCDTTFSLLKKGKNRILPLQKKKNFVLQELAKPFHDKTVHKSTIEKSSRETIPYL